MSTVAADSAAEGSVAAAELSANCAYQLRARYQLPSRRLSAAGYWAYSARPAGEILDNYYRYLEAIASGDPHIDRLLLRPAVDYLATLASDPARRSAPNVTTESQRQQLAAALWQLAPELVGTQAAPSADYQQEYLAANAAISLPILLSAITNGLVAPFQRLLPAEQPPLIPEPQPAPNAFWQNLRRAREQLPEARYRRRKIISSSVLAALHCSGWQVILTSGLVNLLAYLPAERRPGFNVSEALAEVITSRMLAGAVSGQQITNLFPELLAAWQTAILDLSQALRAQAERELCAG